MGKRERKRDKKRRAGVEKRRGPGGSRQGAAAPLRRGDTPPGASGRADTGGRGGGGEEGPQGGPQRQRQRQSAAGLYSSSQALLVLGDGDFSFSAGLVKQLGSGGRVVATSFDSREDVVAKYGKKAEGCLAMLGKAGAEVAHGVDATKLSRTLPTSSSGPPFDAIIFNFPHTGSQRVHLNRQMLRGFFASARPLLAPSGAIHVTIKTAPPYTGWDVPAQAAEEGLKLARKVPFRFADFPGYQHRTTEKDATKFDAFERRCVTFVFGVAAAGGAITPAVAEPPQQVQAPEQERLQKKGEGKAAPTAKSRAAGAPTIEAANKAEKGGKAPRNKKLRMVLERRARLQAALQQEAAATEGRAEPPGGKSGETVIKPAPVVPAGGTQATGGLSSEHTAAEQKRRKKRRRDVPK
mmetsp:Transcript_11590/g.29712  ORF Transcript_11590/g.29712 Transcript_11590/m.29712 type:complete len:408 (+) Transcript_11590:245-1468(+)